MPRLIDLSQEIYQGMVVYPGHLKTVIWEHVTHDETAKLFDGGMSFQTRGLMLCDHGPTHVDSLSHFDPRPGAQAIDQMPLDRFYGEAICLDVRGHAPQTYITAADLDAALARCGQELRPGDIVLFYTGVYDTLYGAKEYCNQYPGLDESAAEWLVEHRVKAFGVDNPSPDNPISRTYPLHMMGRHHGIHHFENLSNLDQVLNRRFIFMGFPLRIRAGTGSPVRAVALVED